VTRTVAVGVDRGSVFGMPPVSWAPVAPRRSPSPQRSCSGGSARSWWKAEVGSGVLVSTTAEPSSTPWGPLTENQSGTVVGTASGDPSTVTSSGMVLVPRRMPTAASLKSRKDITEGMAWTRRSVTIS
jgi:hypothetical protein